MTLVATSFSDAHKKIEIERERAESGMQSPWFSKFDYDRLCTSAHSMYLAEKHAHTVTVKDVDERMCQG